MIAYSPDAEPARAFLLKSYNDVDVFVEDAACQNMYVRLVNRMLAGRARINQVFPLQGRENVLARCRSDQSPRPRKRLYIIDADQDLIRGRPAPRLRHLYRLKVYCAENLLLSEGALVTLATECQTSATWPDMALALALRPLLERSVELLMPLFIVYAVVSELGLSIETIGYPVYRLLDQPGDPSTLSENRIRSRAFSLIREIRSKVSARRYRTVRNGILRRVARSRRDQSAYISGKTYLLPLAYLQLKGAAGLNDSLERVKVRLAEHCELNVDPGLPRVVRNAAR